MARVTLVRSARAQLMALPDSVADAVLDAITLLEGNPKAGHALRGRLRGLRAVRLGSYRLIYDIVDKGKTVRILAIWHREVAYRRDPRR